MLPSREEILKSVHFKTSRSGGSGGQNVNKVSSKVELIYNLTDALYFTAEERDRLMNKLGKRLDSEGLLHLVCQEERSQLLNKEKTIVKLIDLLNRALQVQKKRKPTKIPKAVIRKRLNDKSVNADKKKSRQKPGID